MSRKKEPHKEDLTASVVGKKNFHTKILKYDPDLWTTHYQSKFAEFFKPAVPDKKDKYRSRYEPGWSPVEESLIEQQQREEQVVLQRIRAERSLKLQDGAQEVEGEEDKEKTGATKKPRIYNLPLPERIRPPLPGDISKPARIDLRTMEWKGLQRPFKDPRFEPLLPSNQEPIFMTSIISPFHYYQRRRKFPDLNRCPNLPIPEGRFIFPEKEGHSSCQRHTAMRGDRLPRKKFPRAYFRTHLW